MNTLARIAAATLTGLSCLAAQAQVDPCTQLANKTQCFTFTYGGGFSNSYTASFGADGSFTFPDVAGTTGTYTCYGSGLTDVNYAYAGSEQQSWYGVAGKKGKSMKGAGKAPVSGYMYSFTSVAGACPAAVNGPSTSRQDR